MLRLFCWLQQAQSAGRLNHHVRVADTLRKPILRHKMALYGMQRV